MENKENLTNRKQFMLHESIRTMDILSKEQSKQEVPSLKQKNPKPPRRKNIGEGKKVAKEQIKRTKVASEGSKSFPLTEETELCRMRLELGELLTEQANLKTKEKKLRQSIRKLQRNATSSLIFLNHESIEEVLARVFISQSTPSIVHPHRQNIKSSLWEMSYQTPEYEESRKRRRISFAADKNEIELQSNSAREIVIDQTIDSSLSVEVIDLDEVQGSSILSQLLQEFEKPVEKTPPHSLETCPFGEAEEEIEAILDDFHPLNGSTSRLIESFETLIQVLTDRTRMQSDRDNLKVKVLARLGEYRRTAEKKLSEEQLLLQTQKMLDIPNRSSQIKIDLTEDGSDVLLSQPMIPSSSDQTLKHTDNFSLSGRNEQPFLTNEGSCTYSSARVTKEKQFVQDETDDIFAKLEQRQLEMQNQKTLKKSESFFEGLSSNNQMSSILQQEPKIYHPSSVPNYTESTTLLLHSSQPFAHPAQISNSSSNLYSHVQSSSQISGNMADNTDWAAITDEQLRAMADQYSLRFENRPKLISLLRQMAAKFQASTDQPSSSSTSSRRKTKTRALGLQELKEFLESESDLYQQILCFMPVSFEEIYGRIQNKGFYTTKEQLLPLLDSLAIFVSTSASGHVVTSKRKKSNNVNESF